MLYRAVLLTVVAFWLRDRLYEGGAEDTVTFAGGAVHLDLLTAGQWGALALGAAGGVLAFMLRAWREKAMVEKAEVRFHVLRHSDAYRMTLVTVFAAGRQGVHSERPMFCTAS